ncbi:oxygen-insensitive NAD(P)H nitroreductase [Campylobacter pinnipediorum]|uniref:oxygen-insensitive NAD(P)H nitroreductase n=1 Tax=Campylobacter pinnipediorum TaxID=1965231 RepID=UPI00084DBE65|nr:oxygen-insensitive NAD(P)H nitroreductase [Campylobacter pinnipediorum]
MRSIRDIMNERYTTKVFDSNKKISDEDFDQIESILELTPTSTNLQPLYFVIASNDESKARISKATQGQFEFNLKKIQNASHIIVFCSKCFVEDAHLQNVIEQEDADGRFLKPEFKDKVRQTREYFLNFHRFDLKDEAHWHAKQAYLSLGSVLMAAASLGIDTTAIEGFDSNALDNELKIRELRYTSQIILALGYKKENGDFNYTLPKSRLNKNLIIRKN